MPRLFFCLLLLLSVNSFFCKSKSSEKRDEVQLSYITIYTAFSVMEEIGEDVLLEANERMTEVKNDKGAIVDTRRLQELLDSAQMAGQLRLAILTSAQEVDDDIRFREKALKFATLLDKLNQNELVQIVEILNSNAEDRFEKCQTILFPGLKELKAQWVLCSEAEQEVKEKYDIEVYAIP